MAMIFWIFLVIALGGLLLLLALGAADSGLRTSTVGVSAVATEAVASYEPC